MLRWNWRLICAGVLVGVPMVYAQPDTRSPQSNKDTAASEVSQRPANSDRSSKDRVWDRVRDRVRDRKGDVPFPPPSPGMRRRGGGPPPMKLTPQQETELFTILKEVNPELVEKVKTWQEVNPQHSARMLARIYGRMKSLMKLKERDQKLYELKVKDIRFDANCRSLAKEYRSDPSDQTLKLLREAIAKHFEVRQEIRGYELSKLKKKIELLETQLKEDAQSREKIINQKLEKVTSARRKEKNN